MKSKIALALLASVAVIAAAVTDASAAGHGGGGGGGHGGGGGGFHGGGGGGFHAMGGGMRMGGGGGFHPGGGGMAFRSGGFHLHAGSINNAGRAGNFRGYAGRNFGSRAFANRGASGAFARRTAGVRTLGQRNGRFGAAAAGAAVGAAAVTHAQFAHNQFAARNFHGLYNFNRTGFNRNAFGEGQQWNRWGGRFWGAGWQRWGRGWGGWAGPVFWPYLYGDVFSFAFWPYDYYDPFWAFGPDFVLASIFAPGPYFGSDYGYAPDYGYVPGTTTGYSGGGQVYYGTSTRADRQALAETNAAAMESCNGLAPGVTDLPIEQIKKTVRPTGDQLTALDDLKAAALKAQDAAKGSCPTAVPLTPVARLDTAEARLESVIQAVQIVHDPLQTFYDSLSDEQKHRFDSMGSSGGGGGKAPAGGNLAALCGEQSGDVAKLPVQRIEQVVQPSGQQQEDAFNALKQAAHDAAEQLQTSCPKEVPQTPVARLDAVKTRLAAMVEAMKTIRPKLQDFYGSLNDEQKAKFNIMGPAQSASSGAQQEND